MIRLANKTNAGSPTSTWPFGKIVNDPGTNTGSPVDEQAYQDIHQFFEKLFDTSGLTANNLPDNFDNGFQLYQALQKIIALGEPGHEAGAWIDAGTTLGAIDLNGTGTVTFASGDIQYNRYKLMGRTLFWQVLVKEGTISGTVTAIGIPLPSALLSDYKFVNQNMKLPGTYNSANNLIITTGLTTAYFPEDVSWIGLVPESGTFGTGTNNQYLYINIVAELEPL